MPVKKIKIQPTYIKENGLFVINFDDIPELPFKVKEQSIIYIPKGEKGGNHFHPRWEAFIALSSGLELVWQEDNLIKKESMKKNKDLYLYIVEPGMPHAIINSSLKNEGFLMEFADMSQKNVSQIILI